MTSDTFLSATDDAAKMNRQYIPSIGRYLQQFETQQGADLYLTVGSPPMMRTQGDMMVALDTQILQPVDIQALLSQLVSEDTISEFESTLEFNTALEWNHNLRLRLNIFKQRQHTGMVLRRIQLQIPTIESLGLPETYRTLAMEKRGLVLIVGQTGSGKSTSMAAMIDERNRKSTGHIVTIEDPIEFIHHHKQCLITQRDVGVDTYSFGVALKNVLRQRPDVVVIGEIRDRENMEHALMFAESGHLCIATLHAGNTTQALERVLNFFPEEKHRQLLHNLSHNLKGVLSQRLLRNVHEGRSLACEIMRNEGLVRTLISEGKMGSIGEQIERSRDTGMISFDQSLFDLVTKGLVDEATAIAESDNPANLKLRLSQKNSFRAPQQHLSIPLKRDTF